MAFSEEKARRLTALLGDVEGRKAYADAAATHKDVPALKEMVALVEEQLALDTDEATLTDGIAVLGYVADRYDSLGRFAVSARIYTRVLHLAWQRKRLYGADTDGVRDLFYRALCARNFYVDDDCADLVAVAVCLMPADEAERMVNERKEHRRSLRHDPVEMTDAYLAVIDEVEERVEKTRTTHGHGSCHEVWSLTKTYLAEHGIVWRTPAEWNPHVRFD